MEATPPISWHLLDTNFDSEKFSFPLVTSGIFDLTLTSKNLENSIILDSFYVILQRWNDILAGCPRYNLEKNIFFDLLKYIFLRNAI